MIKRELVSPECALWTKRKVERGIDYVQSNALKRRTFRSLSEQNAHLAHWESTVADTRIHGTTRKQVGMVHLPGCNCYRLMTELCQNYFNIKL